MPMYRALTKCYVGGAVRKEGDVFEWNGEPSAHCEAINNSKAAAPVAETKEEAKPAPKAKRAVKAKADAEGTA